MSTTPAFLPQPDRPLVLASTSPYRRKLLEDLGLAFDCEAPDFDEGAFPREGLNPEELALALAVGKARSLEGSRSDGLILAGDQLAEIDGRVLGKPGGHVAALEQLRILSGREHRLVTATVLLDPTSGWVDKRLTVHRMHLRALDDAALEDYLRRDEPYDCAGSYRVEAAGMALFERMEGPDHTGIIGMPVTAVVSLLEGWSRREG